MRRRISTVTSTRQRVAAAAHPAAARPRRQVLRSGPALGCSAGFWIAILVAGADKPAGAGLAARLAAHAAARTPLSSPLALFRSPTGARQTLVFPARHEAVVPGE